MGDNMEDEKQCGVCGFYLHLDLTTSEHECSNCGGGTFEQEV
jgi:predicted RNA-binding Zn-ribbon protein involved in translation (DUF1610 family)